MSRDLDDTDRFAATDDFASRFFVPSSDTVGMRYGGATHIGTVREKNEDHFAIIQRSRSQQYLVTNLPPDNQHSFRDETYALVVTDGIGGAAAGELASRLVLEEACELSSQASSWVMKSSNPSDQQARDRIEAYTARMHEKLLNEARGNPQLTGMGTTWTSAYVVGWHAFIAHLGDSRAYLFREGTLQQLTRDHTLGQALADRGIAAEVTDQFRHVVTNALGGRRSEAIPDVDYFVLQDGDRLMLCTDGLPDFVSDEEISQILRSISQPKNACDALIAAALDHGGKDNVTAILGDVYRID